MWLGLLEVVVALTVAVIVFFKWRYQYWKRKGVPNMEPRIPFGNLTSPFNNINSSISFKNQYEKMKAKGWRHAGSYLITSPRYIPLDLDYVKNIMTKDFQHFTDRGMYYNEKDDPLSAHLFAIGGEKWHNLRTKLSPTFTSGKMKMMFNTLVDCAPNLLKKIESLRLDNKPIDIKEALACFTTDIIGSCAFGLECNSFQEKDSPFRYYGRRIFTITTFTLLKLFFSLSCPTLARFIGIKLTPDDVTQFFMKVVKDTVSYREENNSSRKDFIQLLVDLKNNKLAEDGTTLTVDEIAAQCFVFFVAGFETSSTTMSFVLYELARRPDLQDRVRREVNDILSKHEGAITYDAIQELKYMDQVINETLRMYPPVPLVTRMCVDDYKIPDHDIIIEKGTTVMIPIIGIHYDKEYYPEPEKFDPDRFTPENKATRHSYAHIPFGEGPRICIGMRFAMIQTKVGLVSLLKNYKFTVNSKTQQPLKIKKKTFILAAEGDIWLNAERI